MPVLISDGVCRLLGELGKVWRHHQRSVENFICTRQDGCSQLLFFFFFPNTNWKQRYLDKGSLLWNDAEHRWAQVLWCLGEIIYTQTVSPVAYQLWSRWLWRFFLSPIQIPSACWLISKSEVFATQLNCFRPNQMPSIAKYPYLSRITKSKISPLEMQKWNAYTCKTWCYLPTSCS